MKDSRQIPNRLECIESIATLKRFTRHITVGSVSFRLRSFRQILLVKTIKNPFILVPRHCVWCYLRTADKLLRGKWLQPTDTFIPKLLPSRSSLTFLLPLDGNALAVFASPDDLGRGETIGTTCHVDILIFSYGHWRGSAFDVQNVWRHCWNGIRYKRKITS